MHLDGFFAANFLVDKELIHLILVVSLQLNNFSELFVSDNAAVAAEILQEGEKDEVSETHFRLKKTHRSLPKHPWW